MKSILALDAAAAAALVFFCAGGSLAQEPTTLSLTCRPPKGRDLNVQLAGESRLPNGVVLELALNQICEMWESNKLKTKKVRTDSGMVRIENGRFSRHRASSRST
jgi:hypothetical protein